MHVGPRPDEIGGMATVLRVYQSFPWTRIECTIIPSFANGSFLSTMPVMVGALKALAAVPRTSRSIAHVHVSHKGSFLREGVVILWAGLLGFDVVTTLHGSGFETTSRRRPWRGLYRFVFQRTRAIGVLNDTVKRIIEDELNVTTPVVIVPNPGPIGGTSAALMSAGSAGPVVVFAGAVGRRKGVDTLIGAWPRVRRSVPDAELRVLGPVQDEDLISKLEQPGIRYLGPTDSAGVVEQIGVARVATLPSRGEGMPMFLLEAMALGRPIVVTDIGAMAQLAAGAGTVVPPDDPDSLADALIGYLRDAGSADRDGDAARAAYRAMFNPQGIEDQLVAFYEAALR